MLNPVENHSLPRTAAFFDLDKTVIAKSSALTFSKSFYRGGLINRRAVLRSAYVQFIFLAGGADHEQIERMRAYLSALCRGWNVQQVREIVAEALHDLIDPLIYDEAASLIEEHHLAGRDVVIVSTSGAEVVEPIGELLGADRVVATRMVVENGHFTGEIEYYAYGQTKADAIAALAESEGYDLSRCYAYSDSATDIPMLEAVGHPHAVNPSRALRKEAAKRQWPVLSFDRPVQLKKRVAALRIPAWADRAGTPSGPALLAAAAAGAVAAAGLVWYASRRRSVLARI